MIDIRQAPHTDELADRLLDLAVEVDAPVIVIGLRKRSRAGRFLLGSTPSGSLWAPTSRYSQ